MFAAAIVASNRNAGRARDLGSMGTLQFSRRNNFNSSNDASSGMFVIVMSVVLSSVLMILGIVYLVNSTSHQREQAVSEYGATVQTWEASERHMFEQLDILARTVVLDGQQDSTQNGSVAEHLAENITIDKMKDIRKGDDLPEYKPLVYRVYGAAEGFLPPMSYETKEESKQIEAVLPIFSVELTLRQLGGTASVLQTSGTPLKRIHKVHARSPDPVNNCRNSQHGEFHFGLCHITKRLVGICVQVERNPQADPVQWRLALRNPDDESSYGCYRGKSGAWEWAKYEDDVPVNVSKSGPRKMHKAPSPLVLEVRSAADPLFKALEITDGQLDFGPSSSDNRAMGLLLLVIGIVLALPACCRVTLLFCWPSPDKHDYFSHHDSDEVGIGLTDTGGGPEGQWLGQETQMRDWSVPRSRSPPPLRYC